MATLMAATAFVAGAQTHIDFARDIAPILEQHCLECHHEGTSSSGLQLLSRQEVIRTGNVIPGKPDASGLYTSMLNGWMPPAGKLADHDLALIRDWIREGASWPAGVVLKRPEKKVETAVAPSAEIENVRRIRERILAHKAGGGMQPYAVTIPNTTVEFSMTPIAAGELTMGPPSHKVGLSAFWMQTREVTWDEFHLFMFANQAGEKDHKDEAVDAISRPTRPYVEMSFGMGINGYPAISMTQHGANKYAEWLSAKTGEFYRLPTEAEWEYACFAGQASVAATPDSAWSSVNSNGKYQKVGVKKPNPWGLYDMLGNVMEWTLDQYAPYSATDQQDPWVPPAKPYPIAVRGGGWNDPPEKITCTGRIQSDASWKQQDPQLPKSIWYETDVPWLGFRLVRPAKLPSAEAMYRYWNNGVEHDER